ncbi:MAG: metallophosphoesterase family protein [Candidatus Zixiibacteriota bacterium]|nr:MAG: metallophosphoesterase family protein [candidate division Zixibacteria bacterium]
MSIDEKDAARKLSRLWADRSIPALETKGKKYVIISDIHLGNGGKADDCRKNRDALARALDYYRKNGYSLIMIGDIEELWQFELHEIVAEYDRLIYSKVRAFGDDRVFRVYGNHDDLWGCPDDPTRNKPIRSAASTEALKLKDARRRIRLLLVHGHQGSKESDKTSWFSRFAVRVYRGIEPYVKFDRHSSATKSRITKNYERVLYSWAKKAKVILICGHSHRAIFASKSYADRLKKEMERLQAVILASPGKKKILKQTYKALRKVHDALLDEEQKNRDIDPAEKLGDPLPCYFNTGCGVFTDGMTAIEIVDDKIKLVKWHRKPKKGETHITFPDCEGSLSQFVKEVNG